MSRAPEWLQLCTAGTAQPSTICHSQGHCVGGGCCPLVPSGAEKGRIPGACFPFFSSVGECVSVHDMEDLSESHAMGKA